MAEPKKAEGEQSPPAEPSEPSAPRLWQCSANGELEQVVDLLNAGESPNIVRVSDQSSPLYMAAQNGHLEVCKRLAKAGANINATRDTGASPLLIATQKNLLPIVKFLVGEGASVTLENDQRATPFTLACSMGHTEVAEVLMGAGSDVSHKSTGLTPLQWSAKCNSKATKHMLLSYVSKDLQQKSWFRRWKRNATQNSTGGIPTFGDLTDLDVGKFPFDLLDLDEKNQPLPGGGRQRTASMIYQPPTTTLPLGVATSTPLRELPGSQKKRDKKQPSAKGVDVHDSSRVSFHKDSRKDGPLVAALTASRDHMDFLPKGEQYDLTTSMLDSIPLSSPPPKRKVSPYRRATLEKRLKLHTLYPEEPKRKKR